MVSGSRLRAEELAFRFGQSRTRGITEKDGTVKGTPAVMKHIWNSEGNDSSVVVKTVTYIPSGG